MLGFIPLFRKNLRLTLTFLLNIELFYYYKKSFNCVVTLFFINLTLNTPDFYKLNNMPEEDEFDFGFDDNCYETS